MPGMRVHELAKEFDMTSKELLDRLAEILSLRLSSVRVSSRTKKLRSLLTSRQKKQSARPRKRLSVVLR